MGNIYIAEFQHTIKDFHNRMKSYQAEIADNNSKYNDEYAKKANDAVMERARADYDTARAKIGDTYRSVRALLGNAMFLDAEKVTADRLFFEFGANYDLRPTDINAFIERYRNNFTMSRMISDWLERKHIEAEPTQSVDEFYDCKVKLPIDELRVYQQFGNSALSLIDSIFTSPVDETEKQVKYYGDEEFGAPLYSVIESGFHLSDYKSKRIPEQMSHYFDDVDLHM
jgi:hypothetical protein